MPVEVDIDLLQEFERGLDPQNPEQSQIPARVLGYGEISTVFEIQVGGMQDLAFKRLPLFYSWEEVERYQVTHDEYLRLLSEEIGLHLPPHDDAIVSGLSDLPVFYIIQRQMPTESVGNRALHHLSERDVSRLVRRLLGELYKVWDFNQRQDRLRVAVDGQISNWSIDGFDPENPSVEGARLWYLDTSTPLFRVEGEEQLDPELFLRSAPSFLVWILRLLFVQDVIDRYYDPRLVTVDLVANFFKEQRADLIPRAIGVVGDFFGTEAASLGVAPITEQEVRAYYREDALIWTLYLAMRKIDRFLHVQLLRRNYPYILPQRIER